MTGSYESTTQYPGYIDPSDASAKTLKAMKDWYYTSHYPSNAAKWQQGAIDLRFVAGDQNLWSAVFGSSEYYRNRRFFFNLIRRHLNMVEGFQREHRKQGMLMPTHEDSDQLSDDWNGLLRWCDDRDGFQEYFSQGFAGAIATGENLLHMYPDYTNDPISGDLMTDQVGYCNYMMDSYYRKQDLSDCSFIWRRRWVTKEAAKALLPGREKEIQALRVNSVKDGRFPLQAQLINLQVHQVMPYDEFYYRTTREGTFIRDTFTGEVIEWDYDIDGDEEQLRDILGQRFWLKSEKRTVPTVKLGISIGDVTFYDGPNLLGVDEYPFVPLLCYHQPDIQSYQLRVQGITRNLRDAQFLYNMRKVIELDIMQSQVTSGWIYPVDVVTDPKAFRQTGQGYLIPLKKGRSPSEVQRIEAPSIPQSMIELSRSLAEDITKISGISEELLGAEVDDASGILSMARQSANLITLKPIFDKLDYSHRLYTKLRRNAIRKNFSKEKAKDILGRDPNPLLFSSKALKYSVIVEEGTYTSTQRQAELRQLIYFREKLQMPISDESIMNAAYINNKQKIIEQMNQQSQQAQQQQEMQAQQQNATQQAELMLKYAQARKELASVEEKHAGAEEKIARTADLMASAEQRELEGDLDLLKTMDEIQENDRQGIINSLQLAEQAKLSLNIPEGGQDGEK